MIIDFHTHVFPDKIASRTIEFLANKGCVTPYSDGSVTGLLGEMEKADADIAITLPVVTNVAQFDSINRFAISINEQFSSSQRRLISFAGIHPKCDDIDKKMRFIKENGFLGVKIHPDYQETFIDDDGYVEILNNAKELDLIVVTHAGIDTGYRDRPVRCTPERALRLIKKVHYGKFVLAHLGGSELSDDVIKTLCGEDVYFDTAFVLKFTEKQVFNEIIDRHGADKILFATDSPWSSIENDVNIIKSFELTKENEEKILHGNAEKLLGIR